MDEHTRRRFLLGSGVVGASTIAAGATRHWWWQLLDRAERTPRAAGDGVLVLVTLYGGNDGLDTVIPVADSAYHDARGALAVAEGDALALGPEGPTGDGFALHPSLPGLRELWNRQRLAVVRGVGYPAPDRSHFRSMDIWQTASPRTPTDTGWVGRWLDAAGGDPLLAVSLGPVLPPMLAGRDSAGAALPLAGLALPAGAAGSQLAALATASAPDSAAQAAVAASYRDLARVAASLGPAVAGQAVAGPAGAGPAVGGTAVGGTAVGGAAGSGGGPDEDDEDKDSESRRAGGSAGSQSELGVQLDVVARCVEAGAPTRVYAVSMGGFDTHAGEAGTHAALLSELDGAIAGFQRRMDAAPGGADVVVAVYSEFGRRVAANGGGGTDHGTAGVLLLTGAGVSGGFHGEAPSLTRLVDGDLAVTTDFRAVYGELLAKTLGSDPGQVLDHVPDALGVLTT